MPELWSVRLKHSPFWSVFRSDCIVSPARGEIICGSALYTVQHQPDPRFSAGAINLPVVVSVRLTIQDWDSGISVIIALHYTVQYDHR